MAHHELTDEEFIEKFKPIQNEFDEDASWSGFMFETFGEELEHVKKALEKDPNTVWTVLDIEGYFVVGDGYHHVNRMGYIITEVPADPNDTYDVMDADDRKEMANGGPEDDDDDFEANCINAKTASMDPHVDGVVPTPITQEEKDFLNGDAPGL